MKKSFSKQVKLKMEGESMIRSIENEDDLIYVIDAHWRIYSTEYNFDNSFIEFFTEPIKSYFKSYKSEKGDLWILEVDNQPKGCIAIVKSDDDDKAQLRWLLLEPEARNSGYGKKLVEQTIQFCKEKKYKKIFLWTNNSLETARAIYSKHGFQIVKSRPRIISNNETIEEKWELIL
jgi:N-acetylglutamate synthase-like GNAT family acetyltransferase